MERLAKDKITKQQRILLLRREGSGYLDNMDSALLFPETDLGSVRERGKTNSQTHTHTLFYIDIISESSPIIRILIEY